MGNSNILKNNITINIDKHLYLLVIKGERGKKIAYFPLIKVDDITKKISIYHDYDLMAFQNRIYNEKIVLEEEGITIFFLPISYDKFNTYKNILMRNKNAIIKNYSSMKKEIIDDYKAADISIEFGWEDNILLEASTALDLNRPCILENLVIVF